MKLLTIIGAIFSIITGSLAIASFLYPYLFTIPIPTMSILGTETKEIFLGWVFVGSLVFSLILALIEVM